MDDFNLFFVMVITCYSELSTLNFRESGNFTDLWDTIHYSGILWPVESKSAINFHQQTLGTLSGLLPGETLPLFDKGESIRQL